MKESYPQQIMTQCLKVDDLLKTVQKSLQNDGDNIDGFYNHYYDLLDIAMSINWENHDIADQMSKDDFRRNLKLE